MTGPRIAVVVPAHDAAAFLPDALRSLFEQTLAPEEIVVVDDGSGDGTHRVAERLGVRCVRQEQAGPAAARNRGLRETTAPLVAFLDADDWFLPGKLERQAAALATSDAPLCCSDAFVVRDGDGAGRQRKNARRRVPGRIGFHDLLADNPVICSTVLARRQALEEAGGFDEDPVLVATEDYDLWLRLARSAPLLYLDEPLVCYRAHGTGLSDNLRFWRGVDRIMDKVVQSDPADRRLRALADRRRALVCLDLAWDRIEQGDRQQARAWLRRARELGAPFLRWLRMFARTLRR